MKTAIKTHRIADLPVGAQFYFTDPDLSHGVNKCTCFRRTNKGVTNQATGYNTRFADSPQLLSREAVTVDDWNAYIGPILAQLEREALDVIGDRLVSFEGITEAGWRIYMTTSGHMSVKAPDGRNEFIYAPKLMDLRPFAERQRQPVALRH